MRFWGEWQGRGNRRLYFPYLFLHSFVCRCCVVQHFDLGNTGCMASRGSPESQNNGDTVDWRSWGDKLALIMYGNFVILFRRMC